MAENICDTIGGGVVEIFGVVLDVHDGDDIETEEDTGDEGHTKADEAILVRGEEWLLGSNGSGHVGIGDGVPAFEARRGWVADGWETGRVGCEGFTRNGVDAFGVDIIYEQSRGRISSADEGEESCTNKNKHDTENIHPGDGCRFRLETEEAPESSGPSQYTVDGIPDEDGDGHPKTAHGWDLHNVAKSPAEATNAGDRVEGAESIDGIHHKSNRENTGTHGPLNKHSITAIELFDRNKGWTEAE